MIDSYRMKNKKSMHTTNQNLSMIVSFILMLLASNVEASEVFHKNDLAIDGYDLVGYFTETKPIKGMPEFRVEYHGSTFQFVSAVHRDTFTSHPEKFVPQYGGYCAYGMAKGYKASIDPTAFTIVEGKLYLNYSEGVRSRWLTDIPGNIRKADENWPEVKISEKVQG